MPSSSDGVVTATVDSTYAAVKLVIDWGQGSSPITSTAGTTVYSTTVTESTSGNVVRGISTAPGGVIVGYDQEAPLGIALSYKAQAFGVSGNLLATSTAATAVIPAATTTTWIKQLSAPSLAVSVNVATIPDWSADIAQGVIPIIGSPYPIVVQDVRQAETGTIEVLTQTAAAEAALKTLLANPGPYLLQQPGFGTVDRYVMVGKYTRKRPVNKAPEVFRVWSLPLTQVIRPPVAGWSVAIPGRTYADTQAAAPLYSNRTGTYQSRATP